MATPFPASRFAPPAADPNTRVVEVDSINLFDILGQIMRFGSELTESLPGKAKR